MRRILKKNLNFEKNSCHYSYYATTIILLKTYLILVLVGVWKKMFVIFSCQTLIYIFFLLNVVLILGNKILYFQFTVGPVGNPLPLHVVRATLAQ